MTSIDKLVERLKYATEWQRTPEKLTDADYHNMIMSGIETLYIDTGRASAYSDDLYQTDEEAGLCLIDDLPIDEIKYVLLTAQIDFFKKVQSDVNNIVSYSTDALTVTSADKPYAHLQDTIGKLDAERRIVYYKMVRYCF